MNQQAKSLSPIVQTSKRYRNADEYLRHRAEKEKEGLDLCVNCRGVLPLGTAVCIGFGLYACPRCAKIYDV